MWLPLVAAVQQVAVESSGALHLQTEQWPWSDPAPAPAPPPAPACLAPGLDDAGLEAFAVHKLRDAYGASMDLLEDDAGAFDGDGEEAWREESSDKHSHLYGELGSEGMYLALAGAACPGGAPCRVARRLPEFRFFDLGSGLGKFPAFARQLGMNATGIELDKERFAQSEQYAKKLACAPELVHASFLEKDSPWLKGKEKRVVYVSGVAFEGLWDKLAARMQEAEWGPDSVVVTLGREFTKASGLVPAVAGFTPVATSWGASMLFFYRKP